MVHVQVTDVPLPPLGRRDEHHGFVRAVRVGRQAAGGQSHRASKSRDVFAAIGTRDGIEQPRRAFAHGRDPFLVERVRAEVPLHLLSLRFVVRTHHGHGSVHPPRPVFLLRHSPVLVGERLQRLHHPRPGVGIEARAGEQPHADLIRLVLHRPAVRQDDRQLRRRLRAHHRGRRHRAAQKIHPEHSRKRPTD